MFCHGSSPTKKPPDDVIHRWGGGRKKEKNLTEDLPEFHSHLGENESCFVLQKRKNCVTFNESKARTNTMLRTLIPQSCQQPLKIAEHDEWRKKEKGAVTDKEASIIHISCECACESLCACMTVRLYFRTHFLPWNTQVSGEAFF